MSPKPATLPAVSEREFTAQVIELLRLLGYRVAHFRGAWSSRGFRTPVQGDGAGFPDIVAVRGSRIVAAELKVGRNQASPDQLEWLARFAAAGALTAIWRPEDFQQIAETLR